MGAEYQWSGIPAALLILALGLGASLAVGLLDSAIRVLAKRADPILTIYTLAASVLSGTYYPLEVLPRWLLAVSWLLPHTYVLQALRSVLMPGTISTQGPTTMQAILALVGFCLVFLPIGLWLYGRSLEYGRKMGVLSGY
jgi:ABC-2 type transport system permease protein